jgi:ABC-type proline/glycine betaine transport system ATPase subunit
MAAIFEFKNVSYVAPVLNRKTPALSILSDISFTIARGTFIVITGPSGSGKSTLLRLFNRLADPTSGTIFFDGKDIIEHPIMELRRKIGWVPQVPVRFPGSVEANLRLPFLISKEHKYPSEEIDNAVKGLKELDLLPPELFKREACNLSVGEAQRLNLLRALALKPEVLLLDEPTSALDPDAADSLLAQIARVREEWNLTSIMVSHRPDEVARVHGTIMRVEHGRLVV